MTRKSKNPNPGGDPRRSVPSVTVLLNEPAVQTMIETHSRLLVMDAIHGALAWFRERLSGEGSAPDIGEVVSKVRLLLDESERDRLRPVVNASGIILHTGLGRSVLPQRAVEVRLRVENLTCRGRVNLFLYFLERDDLFEIPGYIKVEAWPDPGVADVRITFDPEKVDEDAIKQAITEPYYDATSDLWRVSPFRIEGYDPLTIPGDLSGIMLPPP